MVGNNIAADYSIRLFLCDYQFAMHRVLHESLCIHTQPRDWAKH